MKLAFSSNAFRRHSLEEAIAAVADAGYAGIEIMADRPHAWPPDVDDARREAITRALERHGLGISNLNAFMMCAVGDFYTPSWVDDRRRERIDHTIASLRLAAGWGAKTVSTEPGGRPGPGSAGAAPSFPDPGAGPPDPGAGPPDPSNRVQGDALALFREGLAEAARAAEEVGVRLLVEPEPGLLLETTRQAQEFLAGLPSPALGINFDLGHLFCAGEDPAGAIRRFGARVDHVHLEDIAADRRHFHLPPGEGTMDFEAIFAALYDIRYAGWVTVELYPYLEDAPAVAARARRFLERFGV